MRVERLGPGHSLGEFNCGVKVLDDWLRLPALENQRRDLSRTFVLLDDTEVVVGFYSLTMGGVDKDELPRRYGRGLPSLEIGMVLLARLAIAANHHGEGLGRDLVVDAIMHATVAGTHAAARFIGVDPIDEAARSFYRHFGFGDVEGDERRRMYLRIDEALRSLARADETP